MRPQSLGEILSKLEKSGYITRTPSETDRRVMNIKLTDDGIKAVGSTTQEFSFDKLFECLSEEEQKNLSGYLRRIIETLEAQLGDEQSEADFDPRQHRGNQLDHIFHGHSNWADGRGDFSDGQFDPGLEMGQNTHGKMPFRKHPGASPWDHRAEKSQGHEERPDTTQNKPEEE
jgi:DNA-binding PadR family transcriptional regulator